MPDIVYHYTSLRAMMEIAKSQTIWGTSIKYLNDVSERKLFLDAVREQMPQFRAEQSLGEVPGLQDDPTESDYVLTALPFVASFSRYGDSLTHWGMYCPEASGVSIGFRTECLSRATCVTSEERKQIAWASPAKPEFAAVRYLKSRTDPQIQASIALAYDNAEDFLDAISEETDDDIPDLETVFGSNLEAAASFFKHAHFENEQEFRLLQKQIQFTGTALRFRPVRSTLVPYIEFSIPARLNPPPLPKYSRRRSSWDAIAEVIVGPSPNEDLTVEAVNAFFTVNFMRVDVKKSDVPYRVW